VQTGSSTRAPTTLRHTRQSPIKTDANIRSTALTPPDRSRASPGTSTDSVPRPGAKNRTGWAPTASLQAHAEAKRSGVGGGAPLSGRGSHDAAMASGVNETLESQPTYPLETARHLPRCHPIRPTRSAAGGLWFAFLDCLGLATYHPPL